jgi:predicted RNA-binding Zn-ribbon protein involved in translation (DUF1610 family)
MPTGGLSSQLGHSGYRKGAARVVKSSSATVERFDVAKLGGLAEGTIAMTTIKATCPTCGEVELTADDLTLMVCSQAPLSYYAFRCPRCIEEIRKPADDHIISLLVSGGVRATSWSIPAEALEEHDGSSISYDELLDFALAVERTDYLAALAEHAFRA